MISTTSQSIDSLPDLFHRQQEHQSVLRATTSRERKERLQRIDNFLQEERHLKALSKALWADFRKPEAEVMATEVMIIRQQYRHIRRNLRRWMRDLGISTPWPLIGTTSYIHYEPKGTCLIMAPWNYPFQLAVYPILYGLAAGNTLVVKPSEMAPHTSAFLRNMISSLFPPEEVAVVEGDAEVAQALLDLPFNHVFFTGSPKVGKLVMQAAARHLSSVTLELGGKSPAIVAPDAPIKATAERTAWAKFLNNGQTCIAPDYVLVHESVRDAFAGAFCESIKTMYGHDHKAIQASPDYSRIINDRHFDRLRSLLDDATKGGATTVFGGSYDASDRFIMPTLLENVSSDMRIMQEEIFGPIMPIITYREPEEAVELINRHPKPLAFYINSRNQRTIRYFMEHSSAGGTLVNDYMLGLSNPNLPFGGVNHSGIGKSLGFHGFVEFSNERSVIERRWGTLKPLYPPYTNLKSSIIRLLSRWA
jgi:aldehyde dehydrogenase (NAD+)